MDSAENSTEQKNDQVTNRFAAENRQLSKADLSLNHSFMFMDVDCKLSEQPSPHNLQDVKLTHETVPCETNVDKHYQLGNAENPKKQTDIEMTNRLSATKIPQQSEPDLARKLSSFKNMDLDDNLCDYPSSLHLPDVRHIDETGSCKINAVVRHDQLASVEDSMEQLENRALDTQSHQYSMSNLSPNSSTIRDVDLDGTFCKHSSFSIVKNDRLQHQTVSSKPIGETKCKGMDGAEDSEKSNSESTNRFSASKITQKSEPDLSSPPSFMFMDVGRELSDHSSLQLLHDFKLLHKTVSPETNADMKCDQIGILEDSMEQRIDKMKNNSSVTQTDQYSKSEAHLNLPPLNCMDVDTELFEHSSPSCIQDAKLLHEEVSAGSLAYVKYDPIATLEDSKDLTDDEMTNMSTVPHNPQFSKAHMDLDGKVCDGRSSPHVQDGKLLHERILPETINDAKCIQMGSAQDSKEQTNDEATNRSPLSESPQLLKPDFSLLEGEICLDKFSIRQLQEAFWATFGRQTTIKDKLWLKRRIAMGLTNSCIIPNTHFIIKDNKIVQEHNGEEASMLKPTCDHGAHSLLSDNISCPVIVNCGDPLGSTAQRVDSQDIPSCQKVKVPITVKYDEPLREQLTSKRVRKPTRRYIEELSEMEDKEINGKPACLKSHEPCGDDCCHAKLVTRHNFLGGIQIPRVCRLRRGRRRTDFTSVLKTIHVDLQIQNREIYNNEEGQCSVICGNNSNDNIHGVPFLKNDMGNMVLKIDDSADKAENLQGMMHDRRKQHRAWTLDEVLKLVEGVALYGAGRWSEIRRMVFESSSRSPVDLKDKWRNLLRSSFTHGSNDNMPRNYGKNSSIPIPADILLRVKELAELHSQVPRGCGQKEFPANSRITKEKGASFL